MQGIHSSNLPVVTGICDPNKYRARLNRNLKLGSKLKYLKMEMYKAVDNWTGGNLSEFFVRNNHNYNLRSRSELTVPSINTVFKGQNSISYFGSVIWNSIPAKLREINSFQVFKSEIKAWRPTNYHCRLCKNYIENLGFVNIAS